LGLDTHGDSDWTAVYQARNYAEAGMVKGLLEGEGLTVTTRSLLGVPHLGFSGQVTVLVPGAEEIAALRLISAYLGHPTPPEEQGDDEPPRG